MKRIQFTGLLLIIAFLLSGCMTMMTPKPYKEKPVSGGTASLRLGKDIIVTHVDGKRVSMAGSKQHPIAAGQHELTITYYKLTDMGNGTIKREKAKGMKINDMFEEGKNYLVLYDTKGYYVSVFLVDCTDESKVQIALPKYKRTIMPFVGLYFSPDSSKLLVIHDKQLYIHNSDDGTLEKTLQGHDKFVGAGGLWTPDGSKIITANPTAIKIWDVSSGSEYKSIPIAKAKLAIMLHVTPDGSKIVGQSGNTLKVWNLESGAELQSIEKLYQFLGIAFISLSPEGQYFAAAFADNTTQVLPVNGGPAILTIGQKGETYMPIEFADENTLIALKRSGGIFSAPKYVSVNIGSKQITELSGEYFPRISYSSDGSKIFKVSAVEEGRRYVTEIDAATKKAMRCFSTPSADVFSLMLSPVDNRFATFSFTDGMIRIQEFKSGKPKAVPAAEKSESELILTDDNSGE